MLIPEGTERHFDSKFVAKVRSEIAEAHKRAKKTKANQSLRTPALNTKAARMVPILRNNDWNISQAADSVIAKHPDIWAHYVKLAKGDKAFAMRKMVNYATKLRYLYDEDYDGKHR